MTARGHGDKLGRKYEALIAALLTENTITAAAAKVGINEATAFRWLQLPEVQEAYRDARRQVVQHALSLVQSATAEAVAALRECLAADMPPGVRVQAARTILETAVRAVQVDDFAARLDAIEERLEARQQPGPRGPRPLGGFNHGA